MSGYEWIPALLALGFGQGAIAAPLTNTILVKLRSSDIGFASGILTTGMQLAFAIGIVLIGILFLNAMGSHADAVSGGIAPQLRQSLAVIRLTDIQNDQVVQQFRSCYADYARAADPAAIPASCKNGADSAMVKKLVCGRLNTRQLAKLRRFLRAVPVCAGRVYGFSGSVGARACKRRAGARAAVVMHPLNFRQKRGQTPNLRIGCSVMLL